MTGYPQGATWALGWFLMLTVLMAVAPLAMADNADHLIISEIVAITRDPASTFGSPYIMVVNPTGSDVDMSQVYISNANFSPSTAYYNITIGDPAASNPGGGTSGNFHARFPDSYFLDHGDTLTISLNGSQEYQEAYGRLPDFEIFEDGSTPDTVPEMVEVFPGSINAGPLGGSGPNTPALAQSADSINLYQWNGTSDLVQDLDYVIWGSNQSVRMNKSGVPVGAENYQPETPESSQVPIAPDAPSMGSSFRRLSADEGDEISSGSNGLNGDDEASENLSLTFDEVLVSEAGSIIPAAPAVPHPAAPIFSEIASDPEDPFAGQDVDLTATVVSNSAISSVTFYYSVNDGAYANVTATNTTGDDYTATIPAQIEGAVVVWYCEAVNSATSASRYPVAAPAYTNGWTVAAVPPPGSGAVKLLITEVSVEPDEAEFIEVYNPNSFLVTLSDYYLTDAIHYGTDNTLYWQIAAGTPTADTVGGGNYNDFTARFPDGYEIGAGQTITIAVQGSDNFENNFGFLPDLELYEDGATPDAVPDFRPVFINADSPAGNSIYTAGRTAGSDGRPRGIPELEEYFGESLILYHYALGDDFVTDIDIFIWRHTVGSFPFTFDKTDITIGDHTYLPDTPVEDVQSTPAEVQQGESYNRIVSDSGFQPSVGSNGVEGRDETGEDWATTMQVSGFTPGEYEEREVDFSTNVKLLVDAKTFIPTMGEEFEINFISDLEFETRVRIFDMEGRLVITLYDSRRDGQAGLLNGVTWDGRNSVYERVRAGYYILHLSAVDPATGEEFTTTAPVVVATRLSK